ncbi:MAG: hypothetical protein PF961_16055 [Planctomycetota bacterium]|jgi:hypothetical protein|nr:hypothetical protein [Planctomycetota bacterium]
MKNLIQTLTRWALAALVVALPMSYLFWNWRFTEHAQLRGLSYEAFQARLTDSEAPSYPPYALYFILVVILTVLAVNVIATGLGKIFPRAPETD